MLYIILGTLKRSEALVKDGPSYAIIEDINLERFFCPTHPSYWYYPGPGYLDAFASSIIMSYEMMNELTLIATCIRSYAIHLSLVSKPLHRIILSWPRWSRLLLLYVLNIINEQFVHFLSGDSKREWLIHVLRWEVGFLIIVEWWWRLTWLYYNIFK
jgi:hypothetical protein